MEVIVKKTEYVKTEGVKKSIIFPDEPTYMFETGVRRAIAIIPIWTVWNMREYKKPEEIIEYKVICVYQSSQLKIERFTISMDMVEHYFNFNEKKMIELIDIITDQDYWNNRTKERFMADYDNAINELNKSLEGEVKYIKN